MSFGGAVLWLGKKKKELRASQNEEIRNLPSLWFIEHGLRWKLWVWTSWMLVKMEGTEDHQCCLMFLHHSSLEKWKIDWLLHEWDLLLHMLQWTVKTGAVTKNLASAICACWNLHQFCAKTATLFTPSICLEMRWRFGSIAPFVKWWGNEFVTADRQCLIFTACRGTVINHCEHCISLNPEFIMCSNHACCCCSCWWCHCCWLLCHCIRHDWIFDREAQTSASIWPLICLDCCPCSFLLFTGVFCWHCFCSFGPLNATVRQIVVKAEHEACSFRTNQVIALLWDPRHGHAHWLRSKNHDHQEFRWIRIVCSVEGKGLSMHFPNMIVSLGNTTLVKTLPTSNHQLPICQSPREAMSHC